MLDVHVQVVAAVPCAGASATLVMAAPNLLVVRPAEVPVGVPGLAVVCKVVDDRRSWSVHVMRLVDHMRVRGHGHPDVMILCGRRDRIRHLPVDHVALALVMWACKAKLVAAISLLVGIPQVFPIMVPLVAIDGVRSWHVIGWLGPRPPEVPRQPA